MVTGLFDKALTSWPLVVGSRESPENHTLFTGNFHLRGLPHLFRFPVLSRVFPHFNGSLHRFLGIQHLVSAVKRGGGVHERSVWTRRSKAIGQEHPIWAGVERHLALAATAFGWACPPLPAAVIATVTTVITVVAAEVPHDLLGRECGRIE
jgi:hypothetical protein